MDFGSNEGPHTFGALSTSALILILEQSGDTLQNIRLGSDFNRKESWLDDPSNGLENFKVLRSLKIFSSVLVGEEDDWEDHGGEDHDEEDHDGVVHEYWLATSDVADAEPTSLGELQQSPFLDKGTLSRIQRIAHSLPPSLQKLHIPCSECPDNEMRCLVEEIVKDQPTRLPNLRLLDLSESDGLWPEIVQLKKFETNEFKVRLVDLDCPLLGFMDDRAARQKIINTERESRGLPPKEDHLPRDFD